MTGARSQGVAWLPRGGPERFAAFDCETTGLDPRRDALLQLSAVVFGPDGRREWSTLVDPGRPVDLQIRRLTGITAEELRDAPGPAQALAEFRTVVGELPLVAHNAPFDLGFVEGGLLRHRLPGLNSPVYDTLELARLVWPAAGTFRLEDLAQAHGLELDRAHDALADARAAGALFITLLSELQAIRPAVLGTIAHLLARSPGPLGPLVAELAGGAGPVASLIFAPATEPASQRCEDIAPWDPAALLRPDSALAARLRPFEVRAGQGEMLAKVVTALASDRHLIVEAGTGTGKSLAYLLPALAWAGSDPQRRVVVATHTVNLQEQLVHKDLPVILGSGAVPGRVALLKGRAQYACLKLWNERLAGEVEAEQAPFFARFARWLASTETGDRQELGLYGEDEERFSALSTEAVACTGRRCPFFDPCFLFRARRKAEAASVVVANYALLFSALGTAGAVLPEFNYLICDEAHHLEDEASNHLGEVIGERSLERFWRLLDRGGGGALAALRLQLGPQGLIPGASGRRADEASRRLARAADALRIAREGAAAYFDGLRQWAEGTGAGGGAGAFARTRRFEPRPELGQDPVWDAVQLAGERLVTGLRDLGEALVAVGNALDDGSPDAAGDAERIAELQGLGGRAAELAGTAALSLEGRDGWVTWVEVASTRGGGAGAVVVHGCPIDPGQILQERLFAEKRAVVLTSATLSVRGRFDYLRGRLGLDVGPEAERTDEAMIASPFDFRHQALLAVPSDMPRPAVGDTAGHARTLAAWLLRLLRLTRGHALVLFTSNRLMRAVREELRPPLEAEGIACLAQGIDGSRTALTAALRRGDETVVLGSASFWEGVDVQGDALRCLVMAQLPFWPPDMPLQQARQEAIAARGGNPFRALQLPQAVLRFRQGFGRLIRSGADRGIAVVCDPRLVTAEYGRVFVNSLPGPSTAIARGEQVLAKAASWLAAPLQQGRPPAG